ncbi:MAG: uroporphyrinogen decarboxylase family protein [Spirochaetota bacterium]
MTGKQKVKSCLSFRAPEHAVPWQIGYTSELGNILMESLGLPEERRVVLGKNLYRYNRLEEYLGNHLLFLRNRAVDSVREVGPGLFRDEWGVVWDRTVDRDIGTPVNRVLEDPDLDVLEEPDPDDERRYAHFTPLLEAGGHRYVLVKFSYSLFERAWSLRGMENLMTDFILNPGFVRELFERITRFNLKLLENLQAFPVDGVYFGDDWGYQRSLLMRPETWRAFIKPCLQRMYSRARSLGFDVFIHSCGNITAVLDDLVEIGVNVFNPFQPEVMDIREVISRYAGRLGFYGGLSIQHTLPFGAPGEVREEVAHRLELARRYGGYIVSPSHDMPPDVPVENVVAVRDLLHAQN